MSDMATTAALKRFWHKLGSPVWFYRISYGWMLGFGIAALLLIGIGVVWGLAFAPPDYQQGNSFRIMYVHVPAAMTAQSLYMGMGVAGFVLFVWRMKLADLAIAASLPLGMCLTALALFSGAVWGYPTWGDGIIFDGRTVSNLVLLFLYIGIYALRGAIADSELRGRASALVAMVGTINIPIIKYSVDWWETLHQGDSIGLTQAPTMPPEMYIPLFLVAFGMYAFVGFAVLAYMRTEILNREKSTAWVAELMRGKPHVF